MISFLYGRLVNPDWDDYKKAHEVDFDTFMKQSTWTWFSAVMVQDASIGGLMCHSQSTQTCMGTQVQPCQWGPRQFLVGHGSRKWFLRVQPKVWLWGVYDVLPQVLWMKKFLEEQGIQCERDSFIPRQHEFYPSQEKWKTIKFKAYAEYGDPDHQTHRMKDDGSQHSEAHSEVDDSEAECDANRCEINKNK